VTGLNKAKIFGITLAILGILVILTPHLIFPVCEYHGISATVILPPTYTGFVVTGGTATMPFKCYWMAWAEVAVGIPIVVSALMLVFIRRPETRKVLSLIALTLGVMVILLPTALIGTCPEPTAPCNTGTKPALLALGAVIVGISLSAFYTAGKEKTPYLPEILNTSSLVKQDIKGRALRSTLTIACIAVAVGSLFASSALMEGINHSIELQANKLGADIIVVPKGERESFEHLLLTGMLEKPFYMDRSVEEKLKEIPQVEAVTPQLYMVTLTEASCCAIWSVLLVGFDVETDFVVTPWLSTPLRTPLGRDDVIQGCYLLLPIGGETMFYGHHFKIKAKLEPMGTGFDAAIFIPMEGAYVMAEESYYKAEKPLEVKRGQVSAFFLRVKPGRYSVEDVATLINIKIPAVDTITSSNMFQTVRTQVSSILQTFFVTGGLLWGMATALSATVFSMMINERRREIGLLRAVGANKNYIFKLLVFEAVILALIGGVIGIVGGGSIVYFFNTLIIPSLDFPYIPPTLNSLGLTMGLSLCLAVATGFIAALHPLILVGKTDPYDLIRRGEI